MHFPRRNRKYAQVPTVSSEGARSAASPRRPPFVLLCPPWPFLGPLLPPHPPSCDNVWFIVAFFPVYPHYGLSEPPSPSSRRLDAKTPARLMVPLRRFSFALLLPPCPLLDPILQPYPLFYDSVRFIVVLPRTAAREKVDRTAKERTKRVLQVSPPTTAVREVRRRPAVPCDHKT